MKQEAAAEPYGEYDQLLHKWVETRCPYQIVNRIPIFSYKKKKKKKKLNFYQTLP